MNNNIKGIHYTSVEFDKEGRQLTQPAVPAGTTDLIVMSHGWNNDRADAETLYERLFTNFADLTANDAGIKARKIAILGVIWPSKKFDELISNAPAGNRTAGGAASTGGAADKAKSEAAMHAAIDRIAPLFADSGDADRLAKLHELVPNLEDEPAQIEFVETLRKLLDPDGSHAAEQTKEDGAAVFFRGPAEVIFSRAADSPDAAAALGAPAAGEEVGHAAGIGSFFSKAVNGVSSLLNLTTYFEMKQRAGTVGKSGLAPLLDKLASQVERIHLVGHSFGGRVVTAAAANSTTAKVQSLALLQAAFSHNGFSQKRNGFFRSVIKNHRVAGPILITHTKNDKAVGLAYPTASRISRDNASGFGDADDEFGGIGSNGAQQMEDGEILKTATELLPTGQPYQFGAGKVHNLESSKFIVAPNHGDAHGFVHVPQVAWALSRSILA